MQIVHLSDIHIGYSGKETTAAKSLATHILASFPPTTVVIITGDLVQHGSREEYAEISAILAPLRRKFTVITCPGNHDYSDDTFGAHLSKKSIRAYLEFTGDGPFPQAHVVGENTVFIGLDSADPDDRAWLMMGYVGRKQISRMSSLLAEHENKLKIVYFHHHPFMFRWTMMMLGRTALLKAAKSGGADILLFGHRHWSQEIRNRSGIPLMLASGKSTKPRWFKRSLSFRVLEVDDGRLIRVRIQEVPRVPMSMSDSQA